MNRISVWIVVATVAGSTLSMTGCKPDAAVKQAEVIDKGTRPVSAPLDPATLGTVSGTIHFAGKPPARIKIDMSQDPACTLAPGDNYSEQFIVKDGGLANVYLYVKTGPAVAMTAPSTSTTPVVADQTGCRYVPHVVALMQGQQVEFRNSDPTMHNIHTMPVDVGERTLDISQGPRGKPQIVMFQHPEAMLPVRCNLHPWMNAFINVSATPFFAVSDADGHFTISGLPAGNYTLGAVHEKLGEQTISVTVAPHQTAKADITFSMK